jgi:hypothetical protein
MSSEISLGVNLVVNNPSSGGGYRSLIQQSGTFTQASLGECGQVQSVPTTITDLVITSLTTAGFAYFQNLDSTNYIQIGLDQSGTLASFIRLQPGEFAVLRLEPGINLAAKSHTAACVLWWQVVSN